MLRGNCSVLIPRALSHRLNLSAGSRKVPAKGPPSKRQRRRVQEVEEEEEMEEDEDAAAQEDGGCDTDSAGEIAATAEDLVSC